MVVALVGVMVSNGCAQPEEPTTPCQRARAGAKVRERLKTQAVAGFWRAITACRVKFPA